MKKIIASFLLFLILIGFSLLKESNKEIKSSNEVSVKLTQIQKNKVLESKVSDSNPKQITSKNNLAVQTYNQPDEQEPESKNPLINRIKEVVEENALAVEETKIIPQEKASERQTRLSLIRTTFKYPLLILEEIGDFSNPKEEIVESAQAQVAGHFIVRFLPFLPKEILQQRLNEMGCELSSSVGDNAYLVKIKEEPTIELHFSKKEAVQSLTDLIEEVEPDYFLTTVKLSNDTRLHDLWGMNNEGQTGGTKDKDIDAPEAWEITTGSKDILVGVIDTGIDRDHEDLKANMWTNPNEIAGNGKDDDNNGYIDDVHGWDFYNNDNNPDDDDSHGTHCAGTIGGVGNNGKGVAGVCWNVSMVGIKFLGNDGGYLSDAIKSVTYATKIGVNLTSNSWGGGGYSSTLKRAIDEADQKGIGFVAAAGNHNGNNDSSPSYPASYKSENVISVGASDHFGKKAYFSCYGKSSVDLFAPGVKILSTIPDNKYASFQGTSMAAPHVSGAYALLLSANPTWSVAQVKNALMNATDNEALLKEKCVTGGILNINKALSTKPPTEKNLSVNPSMLDFGKNSKGDPKVLSFTISNFGTDSVTIFGATVGLKNYSVNLSLPKTIKKGEQLKGSIQFTGNEAGNYLSDLNISCDAKNQPSLLIPLVAEVITTPKLLVTPDELNFKLQDDEVKTKAFSLTNSGNGALEYEVKFPKGENWIYSQEQISKKELKTTFAGGNGQNGNFLQLNVDATGGINITSLTGHFKGAGEVKVWKRSGKIEEAIIAKSGWKLVATGNVSPNGTKLYRLTTDVDISDKIKATTGSFQKTFKTDFTLAQGEHTLLFSHEKHGVKYSEETFGAIAGKDENLSILVGYGTSRTSPSSSGSIFKGRKWNGIIYYSTNNTQPKGTLQAGKTIEIKAIGNEKEMSSEYEESNILISSNDPETPEKKIRVTAQKLSEKGGLVFRPSTLNFGNTFIGQANKRTISISNADTSPITIRKFAFDNSVFTHGLKLPLVLNSGEKLEEQFFFTPTKSGKLSSSATILTDENGLKVRNYSVNGSGMIAPSMVVTPNSFSTNLLMNKEKNLSLYISNKGGSPLNWNLEGATQKGGKSLTEERIFDLSHFTPLSKGQVDERKGIPVSKMGGGPDRQGYSWQDNLDATGPKHQWIDISKTGKRLDTLSKTDDGYARVAMPFSIELYGEKFNSAYISSNGYLTFDKGSNMHGHFPLPSSMMPGNLVSPFAMDLAPNRGGDIYYKTSQDELLIQWNKVKDFAGLGEFTFQASLNKNGTIYFHYEKMNGLVDRATTGIQNKTADTGLLVAYNNKQVVSDSTIRVSTSPRWLTSSVHNGVVAAGKTSVVPFTVMSSKMPAGKYMATLSISGNDPLNPEDEVPVTLVVTPTKKIILEPATLNFGSIPVGEKVSKIVKVRNLGNTKIDVSKLESAMNVFTGTLSYQKIEAGKSMDLKVEFTPKNAGSLRVNAKLLSNADNSPTPLTLIGSGLASPALTLNPEKLTVTVAAGQKTTKVVQMSNVKGKAAGTYEYNGIRTKSFASRINPAESTEKAVDPFLANHQADRLIVGFKDGHTTFANLAGLNTSVTLERTLGKARTPGSGKLALDGMNISLVKTNGNESLKSVAEKLSRDPAVAYVEPDYIVNRTANTNDPLISQQWALPKIKAAEAWKMTKGSHAVSVAIIDTGIDYRHPDLQGNIWINPGEIADNGKDDDGNGYIDDIYGWDFSNNDNDPMDGNGHGTHVAGSIAAATNNGKLIAGVAWHTKMAGLKFLSDKGSGSTSDAIDAVAYSSAMGFKVSNNSWGGGGKSRALKTAIEKAGQKGQVFCAAAGNSRKDNDRSPHYPSSYDCKNIISVAASDSSDRLASFSCYGKNSVDLAAPGVRILSLLPNNKTASWSGTSMATPHVAGAAALIFAVNPNAGYAEVKEAIMSSVDPVKAFEGKMMAAGRLNVAKSLGGVSSTWITVSPNKGTVPAGRTANLNVTVDATELKAGEKEVIASFTTNDPKAKSLELPVHVKIIGEPKINLSQKSINFGKVWIGNEKTMAFEISNQGTDLLKVTKIGANNRQFSATPSSLNLEPGTKSIVQIKTKPLSKGILKDNIIISSNDPKTPSAQVTISVEAILPPVLTFNPVEISKTMEQNKNDTDTIIIRNLGDATAVWKATIVETNRNRSRTHDFASLVEGFNKEGRAPEFIDPGLPADGEASSPINLNKRPAFRMESQSKNNGLEVAIIGANTISKNKDIANGLLDTKHFSGVTIIDARVVTPSVNELKKFDSVLVYNNFKYRDSKKMGDNLAGYAEQGGGVVTMVFESSTRVSSTRPLQGRWITKKYGVFSSSSTDRRNWNYLGDVLQKNHPILKDFNTFKGYFRLNKKAVTNGSSLIAKWQDGIPLVACRNDVVTVVGLNFYPVSNNISSKGWDKNTDGWKLMANSLKWVAEGGSSTWITGTPLQGSVLAARTENLKLTIDTENLAEGNYTAEVRFESNDPKTPYFPVKVNLLVRNNQAPIAHSSTVQLKEDTQKSFTLNAVDPDGDSIRYIITNSPKNGKVTGNGKTFTYIPNTNYFGKDELSFKATDGKEEGNTAKVTFIIDGVNDAPWIKSETISGKEDELIVITPKYGDPEGDRVQVQLVQKPKNGYVHNQGNKWIFFPDTNYNGKDTLRFSVSDGKLESEALITFQIEAVNDTPIAFDSIIKTEEGTYVQFELNATDPDYDAITYRLVSAPKHGNLVISKDGKCKYTPFENYYGKDSFSYRASDKMAEGNLGLVNIEVSPVNEAPQLMDATFALEEDGKLPIKLIASDPDGDSITFSIVAQPENGSISGSGPSYKYTPKTNYHGSDFFLVTATDGKLTSKAAKITLNITGKNDAPSFVSTLKALSAGYRETPYRMEIKVTDPDNDNLTIKVEDQPKQGKCFINGNELLYLPDPGFTGMENIKLEVSDGDLSAQTVLNLPIQEHVNPIGIVVDLDNAGKNEQAFVNMVYEVNEQLKKSANYILRMDNEKTSKNFQGSITEKLNSAAIMTLEQWKGQLPHLNPNTNFSFHPKMGNGTTSWTVSSFLDEQSGTDTELGNESSYTENNNESQEGATENKIPVNTSIDITKVSTVKALESAPNWYSMPGLGSFFSAGNGWIYQPEMGWCFTQVCPDGCSTWIFNETLGWIWMSNQLENMTYSFGQLGTGWVFFPETSLGLSKIVYNYANNTWIKLI
ncbi:S8 family serine peptidase [Opitutales bacterium]|nr:S8 family serine peptidase [Opitutales bacterium]